MKSDFPTESKIVFAIIKSSFKACFPRNGRDPFADRNTDIGHDPDEFQILSSTGFDSIQWNPCGDGNDQF
jgi:hypothetical protein